MPINNWEEDEAEAVEETAEEEATEEAAAGDSDWWYPAVCAAIDQVGALMKDPATPYDLKKRLTKQMKFLLEEQRQHLEAYTKPDPASEPEPEPEPVKKERKNSTMSPENRAKAAERMRAMVARKKAEKENGAAVDVIA